MVNVEFAPLLYTSNSPPIGLTTVVPAIILPLPALPVVLTFNDPVTPNDPVIFALPLTVSVAFGDVVLIPILLADWNMTELDIVFDELNSAILCDVPGPTGVNDDDTAFLVQLAVPKNPAELVTGPCINTEPVN